MFDRTDVADLIKVALVMTLMLTIAWISPAPTHSMNHLGFAAMLVVGLASIIVIMARIIEREVDRSMKASKIKIKTRHSDHV